VEEIEEAKGGRDTLHSGVYVWLVLVLGDGV